MILKNCRLVPELSEPHGYSAADIEINQGKIVSIAETQPERACSEEIIDCQGHTLLPGLFDLHAHLSIASAEETPDTAMRQSPRCVLSAKQSRKAACVLCAAKITQTATAIVPTSRLR